MIDVTWKEKEEEEEEEREGEGGKIGIAERDDCIKRDGDSNFNAKNFLVGFRSRYYINILQVSCIQDLANS